MEQTDMFPRAVDPLRKKIPIFRDWIDGVSRSQSLERDVNCTRCRRYLSTEDRSVCLPPHGEAGGLLVVLGAPTRADEGCGEVVLGGVTAAVLREVRKHWDGPVRVVHSVRCGGDAPTKAEMTACLPYLAAEVDRAERVLCVGKVAAQVLHGQKVPVDDVRRAWVYARNKPIFSVPEPSLWNRFAGERFRADVSWALSSEPPPVPKAEVTVLTKREEVVEFVQSLQPGVLSVVDVEHDGKLWEPEFELLCLGICQDPENPHVIPARVAAECVDVLRLYLEGVEYPKAGSDIKHDRHAIWRALGVDLKGIEVDTVTLGRMLDSDSLVGLGVLAWRVGVGGYKAAAHAETEDEQAGGGKKFSRMGANKLHAYNGWDVSANLKVAREMVSDAAGTPQWQTWRSLMRPALNALAIVERWGATIDHERVLRYDQWLADKAQEHLDAIRGLPEVPVNFNPASSQQKQELVFGAMGVVPKKGWANKTGFKVDADVIAYLAETQKHPLFHHLGEHAKYSTQRNRYGEAMLRFRGPDGRIHSTYKMIRSGRLSSKAPNAQNITSPSVTPDDADWEERRWTDLGVWARGCWTAPEGYVLVALDYSQQELRVLAMLSKDRVMIDAFSSGADFHMATAARMFKRDPSQVDKGQRRSAKTVNFAIAYGTSKYGLAHQLNCTPDQAQGMIDAWMAAYPEAAAWMRRQQAIMQRTGKSTAEWSDGNVTWWQCRDAWRMAGQAGNAEAAEKARAHAANIALNNPVQNVANCFCLASVTNTVNWLVASKVDAKLTITVHDSIILEVREDLAEEVARTTRAIMLNWPTGDVPLQVDMEIGPDWGAMRKAPWK